MKRGFTTYVLWFNLQGAKRVSRDYQFRKKVLESSGALCAPFQNCWCFEQYFLTSFATKPDSKSYHLSSIIDGFLSGYDTGLIDNCGRVHRYVIFADFSCNKRDPIKPEDMKNAMKKITGVKM